jgi:hypothetical protein
MDALIANPPDFLTDGMLVAVQSAYANTKGN